MGKTQTVELFCFIAYLYLIDVCVGDNPKHTPVNICVQKRLEYVFKLLLTTLHLIANTIGRAYVFSRVNKYALPITVINSREVQYSI